MWFYLCLDIMILSSCKVTSLAGVCTKQQQPMFIKVVEQVERERDFGFLLAFVALSMFSALTVDHSPVGK